MPHLFVNVLATLFIATCVVASEVAPIWMAPTNLNYPSGRVDSTTFNADIWENFTPNLGEWATIEVATGSRGNRALSVMDSKGIIWIFGGNIDSPGNIFLTAVWNFDPKTDQYRYVWKTNNSSPFVARNAGELRVPALSNHPGGVVFGTAAMDKDDNIWFYTTYSYRGELWMFNTTSWMFVRQFGLNGQNDEPSVGATRGQPGEDVWPGYTEGHCLVIDSKNDVWVLSGQNTHGITSNVWHFNTTSFLWTFIAGSITQINAAHNTTFYGGAWMNGCDIDDNDRVWIYGGVGATTGGSEDNYGDLYSFDTRTKRDWEFEYGENTYQISAVVVSDDYDPGNIPPAAQGPVLIDRRDGTLMLVPGASYISSYYAASNTVWQYSKSLKQWRLVYGNVSVATLNRPGNYSNFRAPGSEMPSLVYLTTVAGKHNGDLYLIGGSGYQDSGPNHKDIWLIPQDQCSNNISKCDVNADCIEEMAGYSCKCKDGFTGDGLTCTGPPVAQPVTDAPLSSETNSTDNTPVKKTLYAPSQFVSGASLIGNSFVSVLVVVTIMAINL